MSKAIKVYTNDPANSLMELKISGRVEDLVHISPRVVRLNGNLSQNIEMRVKITPVAKYPFSIKELHLHDGTNITAQFRPSDLSGGGFDLTVINIREKAGRYFDEIILKTDSDLQPEIRINVFGNVTE